MFTCWLQGSSGRKSVYAAAVLFVGFTGILGCSTSLKGSPSTVTSSTGSSITVAVSGNSSVRIGATVQFTAAVANSTDDSVTWQVNGVAGGASATGTITSDGLYTAPKTLPTPNTVTVTAVSNASSSASGSLTESVLNPAPAISTVALSGTASSYTFTVNGSGFVSGSVVQVQGTAATTTYVSSTELTATATPAVSAGATTIPVAVINPNPGSETSSAVNVPLTSYQAPVSVSVTGPSQVRLGTTVQLTATVTGSTNSAVNWQVNGVTGGSSNVGTISSTGLYTPPSAIPSSGSVTLAAVSQTPSQARGSITETILNPTPSIISAVAVGTSSTYTFNVTGNGFVTGSQVMVQGVAATTTHISSTLLTATATPTLAAGATTIPVAVANPDPGEATSSTANATIQSSAATFTAAARFLDQASFGPTLTDIQNVENAGLAAYLNKQFQMTPTTLALIPNPPQAVCASNQVPCVQSEWWQAALTAPDQLRQRVAFALSEMFVISSDTVNPQAVIAYQNMLVNDAFGNFSTLLNDVTLSPGMAIYLNMLNSAAAPAGQIANENYAREAMQLFTMGTSLLNQDGSLQLDSNGNPIPAYTQDQVQAFARAYTGWTYQKPSGGTQTYFPVYTPNFTVPMMAYESAHDETSKTLLNGTVLPAGQTAEEDLTGALQNLFQHPNVGPFVCRQLIQHLVSSNPSPDYVSRVAAVFADDGNGVRGDMRAVITAILLDPEARAGDTDPTAEGGHLREPVLWMTNVMRGLGYTNNDLVAGNDTVANASFISAANYASKLGQVPYQSSSVFNFFPPSYIIPGTTVNAPEFGMENTANVVIRLSLANTLVFNSVAGFNVDLTSTGAFGTLATNPGNLVDTMNMIFMHGQMSSQMRTEIVNNITPLTNITERVRVAAYLVITSSQYKIEH